MSVVSLIEKIRERKNRNRKFVHRWTGLLVGLKDTEELFTSSEVIGFPWQLVFIAILSNLTCKILVG